MKVTFSNILPLIKLVAVFTAVIGGVYGFVIPEFFPDYKTYLILIIGVGTAALIAGYIGYQFPSASVMWTKVGVGVCCAIVVAILVIFLSLLIILNVRGS